MFNIIVDTPTVAMIAGINDITNILRRLIFPTLLEVSQVLAIQKRL